MKKSVGTVSGAVMGSLLAANVAAQDMSEVKQVSSVIEETQSSIHDIRVYGVGTRYSDNSSDGGGIEMEGTHYKVGLEGTEDYSRAYGVGKVNITDGLYGKGGAGFLQKEMIIDGIETDVDQTTLGGAVGYGDNKHYNIEAGYVWNDLDNANRADTTTNALLVEGIVKYDTGSGGVEAILSYEDVKAYDKHFRETSASLGYYLSDDMRLGMEYTTLEHDKDDYNFMAGFQCALETGEISPYVKATASTGGHYKGSIEYRQGMGNDPLSMGGDFEKNIGNNTIVAQDYNSNEFSKRTKIEDNDDEVIDDIPEVLTSTPTISLVDQVVKDNAGVVPTDLPAPTVTNVDTGAVYSLVGDPTGGMLTINPNTGVCTWFGDLEPNSVNFTITIKVVNPDGGEQSVTFNLYVQNNG